MAVVSAQPCLPDLFGPRVPKAHKRARQTSREAVRRVAADDRRRREAGRETRCGQIHRLLRWYWNAYQHAPTALELLVFGQSKGESLFDINSVRPRIKALVDQGLVEPRSKRTCTQSGETVWTWAVREAGSLEAR